GFRKEKGVFVVVELGVICPIVAARKPFLSIENRELVMHDAAADAFEDVDLDLALLQEGVCVSLLRGLTQVPHLSDAATAPTGLDQGLGDLLRSQAIHRQIDRTLRVMNAFEDLIADLTARREINFIRRKRRQDQKEEYRWFQRAGPGGWRRAASAARSR